MSSASLVTTEAMLINPPNTTPTQIDQSTQAEFATCDCCGFTEECTQPYIHRIRQRYKGKWICGLCAEVVNYEMRMRNQQEDEALLHHMTFCNKFKSSSPPPNPAVHLISTMRSILRRSLQDSPTSMPNSPSRRGRGWRRSGSHVPCTVSPVQLDQSPSPTTTQHDESVHNI